MIAFARPALGLLSRVGLCLAAVVLGGTLGVAGPAAAQLGLGTQAGPATASDRAAVRVLADVAAVAPGETFHVAVVFDITPHWHVYWVDSGASGAPTEITVTAPGCTVGPTQFPRPRAFPEVDGRTYGYDTQTVLFVPVTTPPDLPPGTLSVEIDVFYLVCKDICLIGQTTRTLTLPVLAGVPDDAAPTTVPTTAPTTMPTTIPTTMPATTTKTRPTRVPEADLLETFRRRLPRPLPDDTTARLEGTRLVITGPARGHRTADVFPIEMPGVMYEPPTVRVDGDRFRIEVPLEVRSHNAEGRPMRAAGVVTLGTSPDDPCYSYDVPVPEETGS